MHFTQSFTILLFLIAYIQTQEFAEEIDNEKFAGPILQKQLDHEARKSQCCAKKMRCCKKQPAPPNIEIRAVMARCTNPPTSCMKRRKLTKPIYQANSERLTRFQGFDEDEPLIQSEVTKCNKKLILTMKIKNEGETNTRSQFIVIDHVYDPISSMTVRILNPYVIKLKQDHVSQTYPLKFLDFVNSEAREQVYNKHDTNFTGCCMDDRKPTCGLVKYQGRVIPFSGGFCCSCDAQKNAERQPDTEQMEPRVAASDPAYLMDAVQCPRTDIKEKFLKDNTKRQDAGVAPNANGNNFYYMRQQTDTDGRKMYNEYQAKIMREALNTDVKDDEQYMTNMRNTRVGMDADNNYKIQSMNDEYEDRDLGNFNNLQDTLRKEEFLLDDTQSKTEKHGEPSVSVERQQRNKVKASVKEKLEKLKTDKNAKLKSNKPSMHKLLNTNNIYKPSNIIDLPDAESCKQSAAGKEPERSPNKLDEKSGPSVEDEDLDLLESIYSKRQVQSSGVQRRGGQNCADRYTPPHMNPETYHESAHCLRFSPVWYGVYKIETPIVEQEIVIQIFEKYEIENGLVRWKDITDGKKIRLGTFSPYYKDELPTISLTFNSMYNDESFCMDFHKVRLLIPEGMRVSDLVKYSEAKGGPSEYLIVNSERIVLSGEQCDVAGVGFEAFFKQRNRCSQGRGTCLHHQPKHMWLHDRKMEHNGKKGCYFLKYHGKLAKNPIRKNITSDERFLTMNYYGKYISMIDMEINADFNTVLRPSSTGVLTEVYIDSTCPSRTHITIKLTNGGLLSSKFMVRICDCPLDLKGQMSNLKSDMVLIAPQNQHIFKLTVYNKLDIDIFHCSVEALNHKGELVALRRIRIQKMDRCICTWHCLCACIGSTKGLKCLPMKLDHYHAAGFRGGLPSTIFAEHEMSSDDVVRITTYLIIFIFITLLLLGLTKALIGLCSLPVGVWGLNTLLDLPKPMKRYYEPSLKDKPVEYDDDGWPVHPETKEKVHNIPIPAEFCTNVLFFFTYPTVVLLLLIKRLCCPSTAADQQWFSKKCEPCCQNKEVQADQSSGSSDKSGKKSKGVCCDRSKMKSSKAPSPEKKKPTIKVSIKERAKSKDSKDSKNSSSQRSPTNPTASEKQSEVYYFTSTDDVTSSESK